MAKFRDLSTNQPTNKQIDQQTHQPSNQPDTHIDPAINQPTNRPTVLSTNQQTKWPNNQQTNQQSHKPTNQSTDMGENITPLAEIIIFIVVQCFPKLTYIKHMFSSQQINHRDGAPDVAVYLPKPPNMTTPRVSVALVFGVCPAPLAFGFPFWITNTDHLHLVLRRGSSSHTGHKLVGCQLKSLPGFQVQLFWIFIELHYPPRPNLQYQTLLPVTT